jgi:hypothetical protein
VRSIRACIRSRDRVHIKLMARPRTVYSCTVWPFFVYSYETSTCTCSTTVFISYL